MSEEIDAHRSQALAEPSLSDLPPEFLIRMHEFAESELSRYRDVQWQVPSIVIVFLFALCGAIGTDYVGELIRTRPIKLEGGFSILVVILWIFIIRFVHHTDRNRQKMYNLLLYLERQMKVTPHIQTIVPPTGELTANDKKRLVQKGLILVYPIDAITSLASLLSLFLIWLKK